MNIEELRDGEKYFRQLTPKELAAELREYLERLSIDESAECLWEATNILRAADILDTLTP